MKYPLSMWLLILISATKEKYWIYDRDLTSMKECLKMFHLNYDPGDEGGMESEEHPGHGSSLHVEALG